VNAVLAEVGAGDLPQIEVFNKADLAGETAHTETDETGTIRRVWVSARTGDGANLLIDAIGSFLGPQIVHRDVLLPPSAGKARARFYAAGAVLNEEVTTEGATQLTISMPRLAFERLCRAEGLTELLQDDDGQTFTPDATQNACVA
jgi:GTPase